MAVFEEALKFFPTIPDGITKTSIPGVHYFQESFHKKVEPSVYPAGLCIMLSGQKILNVEEQHFIYGAREYVVCSMVMPLECEIVADSNEPVKGIFIGFSTSDIRELVDSMNLKSRVEQLDSKIIPKPIGPSVMSVEFETSIVRFLSCLTNESDAKVLGPALRREILYRAMCGEQSDLLLKIAMHTGPLANIANIIGSIQNNYNQNIDIDSLAKTANLSVSSFYRLFKEVTSDTPIQYIKKIRLNKARDMIVAENVKAYVAALEVGYESVSQFSREFKRYFGTTPAALKVC